MVAYVRNISRLFITYEEHHLCMLNVMNIDMEKALKLVSYRKLIIRMYAYF